VPASFRAARLKHRTELAMPAHAPAVTMPAHAPAVTMPAI
jgi:hypothetical protein